MIHSTKKKNIDLGTLALLAAVSLVLDGCAGGSQTQAVDQTQTISNLKTVALATAQYTEDYDETLPNATTQPQVQALLMPYTKNSAVFVDPNNNVPFAWNASLARKTLETYPDLTLVMTFYDQQPAVSNAIPVALLNGSVTLETSAQFNSLKTTSGIQ